MTASDPEARSSTLILLSIENKTYIYMRYEIYIRWKRAIIDIKINFYLLFAIYCFISGSEKRDFGGRLLQRKFSFFFLSYKIRLP